MHIIVFTTKIVAQQHLGQEGKTPSSLQLKQLPRLPQPGMILTLLSATLLPHSQMEHDILESTITLTECPQHTKTVH